MRLAVVIPSLAGGGAERVTLNHASQWLEQGIEVDLVVMRFTGPLVALVPTGFRVFEVSRIHNFLFPFGFLRYLNQRKPDHVVSIFVDLNAMVLATARLAKQKPKLALAFHNHLSTEIRTAKAPQAIKKRLSVGALRALPLDQAHIIAVSHAVADDVAIQLALDQNRVHVVYNGVVTDKTREQLNEPLPFRAVPVSIPRILFVGRLVTAKGVDVLIEALALLPKQLNAHLILLGDGPERESLGRLVSVRQLDDRVHFVGFHANPLPWMRDADVLVLPSRREGLPTVLIEALAAGTQIIATDCPGGSAEILRQGELGQLVPPDDVPALNNAIMSVLTGYARVPADKLTASTSRFQASYAAQRYLDILEVGT
jgi:glycosyltransferase involved in cell wall biosynthesis